MHIVSIVLQNLHRCNSDSGSRNAGAEIKTDVPASYITSVLSSRAQELLQHRNCNVKAKSSTQVMVF